MVDAFFLETPKDNRKKSLSRGSRKGKTGKKLYFSPHCGDETTTYYDRSTSTPRRKRHARRGKTEAMRPVQKLTTSRTTAGTPGPHDAACLENGMPHREMPPNQRRWRRGMQKGRYGRPFFLRLCQACIRHIHMTCLT